MIQIPALVMSLVLASLYGMVFYLLLGRKLRDILFFWLASVVGFASGQLVGSRLSIFPWTVGQVHIIEATVVALVFLILARWLTQGKETNE
jgi:hypothetical protein